MAEPHVLTGLVAKRREIAGKIEHLQDQLRQHVIDLDHVDAAIHIFDPSIELEEIKSRPVPPRHQAFRTRVGANKMQPWFNVRKAAQVAAYFALKSGGAINVLKLVKLIYLANRRFAERYDHPMLNDELVSMDHGPVNSMTLNYINGTQIERDAWDEFVDARAGYDIGLASATLTIDALDEFSRAELEVLDETWASFGHYSNYQLRDYTHKHCPEWEDPHGSSTPISYEKLFRHLNKKNFEELAADVNTEREISKAFAA